MCYLDLFPESLKFCILTLYTFYKYHVTRKPPISFNKVTSNIQWAFEYYEDYCGFLLRHGFILILL